MNERFRDTETEPAFISPTEIGPLLERLASGPSAEPPPDHTTIEAVIEATGAPRSQVVEALEAVRGNRYHEILEELERPLYAVERPGLAQMDPLNRIMRDRAVATILDKVREEQDARAVDKQEQAAKQLGTEWRIAVTILLLTLAFAFAYLLLFKTPAAPPPPTVVTPAIQVK